ncbi:MAG: hypothetical protein ACREBG_25410 [Pyrinomonadaceae bacterium]
MPTLIMKAINAKQFLKFLVLVFLILSLREFVNAQSIVNTSQPAASQQQPSPTDKTSEARNSALALTESQKRLMEGSRKAILKTGMSEPYFDEHFRVVAVFDQPGDRRVVWNFRVNEYETIVNDSIGFYTEGGKRTDIHSVASLLSSTSDLKRTIPKSRALKIMAACLGKFGTTAVEYRAAASGKAMLYLTAASIPRPRRLTRKEARERERKEREAREKSTKTLTQGNTDVIEEEGERDRPPIFLGAVNLETGKCSKGIGQAGPPKVR